MASQSGAVDVQNSSYVQVGNRTVFNGPVIIKNIVVDEKLKDSHSSNEAAEPGVRESSSEGSRGVVCC